MKKVIGAFITAFLFGSFAQAQVKLGITAGVNMANEVSVFSNSALSNFEKQASLNGATGGLMLEGIVPVIGLGAEVSALYSKKGSNFKYDLANPTEGYNISIEGTRNIHCIDIPLNLKYKIGIPKVAKVFAVAGWYWSFALLGNVEVKKAQDNNTQASIPDLIKEEKMDFSKSYDKMDSGLDFGFGVEILEKVQIGAYYYISLKNTATEQAVGDMLNENYKFNPGDFDLSASSRLFSVRATYLF